MQWAPSQLSPAVTMPEPNLVGPSQENPIAVDDGRRPRLDKATSLETWEECRRYVSITHAWVVPPQYPSCVIFRSRSRSSLYHADHLVLSRLQHASLTPSPELPPFPAPPPSDHSHGERASVVSTNTEHG
jgi:hypothetical protein